LVKNGLRRVGLECLFDDVVDAFGGVELLTWSIFMKSVSQRGLAWCISWIIILRFHCFLLPINLEMLL
jgi:hypothetical protein